MLLAALVVLGFTGRVIGSAVCQEAPPLPWRHWGCHRWDCGDLVNHTEECRGSVTSTLCSSWTCGEGPELEKTGSFACVGGSWADVLPMCLGPTYPGSPGGSWIGVNYSVRGVLFQLQLSWIPASVYRPEVCSGRTSSGALLLPCKRKDLAVLIQQQIWPLLLFALQADLCPVDLPLDVPNSSWACTGRLSKYGDRVRLAGVNAEWEVEVGQPQNLTFFLEAIAARAHETEVLRNDLLSLYHAFGTSGLQVPAATWHSNVDLPLEAAWLAEGLRQLWDSPLLFNVQVDPEFFRTEWLPSLSVKFLKEPYIINRHWVPGWRLLTLPEIEEDRNLHHLHVVEEVENMAFNILLSTIVIAWAATAACHTCLWSLLYGRQTWNFLNSIRTVCRLGLLTHLMEFGGYLTLLALMLFLAGNGLVIWDLKSFQQELIAQEIQLIMLAPLSAIFPSSVVLFQMLQAPPIPGRTRACGICCRLKKWQWAWIFCLSVLWHALASAGALISVIRPLSMSSKDRPAFEEAMRQCRQEMVGLCQTTDWRQVPDTRWENHVKCGLDCSDVKVPSEDVFLHFYRAAYKLVALCSSCSLLSKSFLLWISCRILKIARRVPKHTNQTQAPADAAAAQPQAIQAVQASPSNEAVLTPSLFQQGAMSARTPRTPRTPSQVDSAERNLEPQQQRVDGHMDGHENQENVELSDEGKIRQRQILEAAMSFPEPPSPSGSVASLNFSRPTAAELRKMLENPLADGHAELVDFAKSIARECTKDSATSDGSVLSSRSRRARG